MKFLRALQCFVSGHAPDPVHTQREVIRVLHRLGGEREVAPAVVHEWACARCGFTVRQVVRAACSICGVAVDEDCDVGLHS